MTRHINMRIVTIHRLVLDVRDGDRDTTSLLLRRLVDLIERRVLRQPLIRQRLGDRRRQRGLTMVNMTHRANVDVWLGALEFCLAHRSLRCRGFIGLSKNVTSLAARAGQLPPQPEQSEGERPSRCVGSGMQRPSSSGRRRCTRR